MQQSDEPTPYGAGPQIRLDPPDMHDDSTVRAIVSLSSNILRIA